MHKAQEADALAPGDHCPQLEMLVEPRQNSSRANANDSPVQFVMAVHLPVDELSNPSLDQLVDYALRRFVDYTKEYAEVYLGSRRPHFNLLTAGYQNFECKRYLITGMPSLYADYCEWKPFVDSI